MQQIKKSFMSAYDLTSDGRLAIHEVHPNLFYNFFYIIVSHAEKFKLIIL